MQTDDLIHATMSRTPGNVCILFFARVFDEVVFSLNEMEIPLVD